MTKRLNPYARIYASFKKHTEDHELRVLHEDGLYRHLRVQAPGTRMWSWDITTWPGHLATSGDISAGYVFSREPDMLEFFARAGMRQNYYSDGAPCIDVRYWAEKLRGPVSRTTEVYSPEVFLAQVKEHLDDVEIVGERRESILEDATAHSEVEHTAREWLADNEHRIDAYDTWEWDLTEYGSGILFACYAIHLTTQLYRAR